METVVSLKFWGHYKTKQSKNKQTNKNKNKTKKKQNKTKKKQTSKQTNKQIQTNKQNKKNSKSIRQKKHPNRSTLYSKESAIAPKHKKRTQGNVFQLFLMDHHFFLSLKWFQLPLIPFLFFYI